MGCVPPRGKREDFRDGYDLGDKVGAGAFAQVRTCKYKATGEDRVVKIIRKPYERDDFRLEIDLLSEVGDGKCDNVIRFHESFEDKYFFYSVMELCRGGELFDVIEKTTRLTERQLALFTSQILRGVEHVHSLGIVHRDIKPQNLLFLDDSHEVLKLIDFGLSYKVPQRELLDEPCGTPEFVAPEMVLGKYGRKVDIWAVGVLTYMMLFGRLPFSEVNEKDLFRRIVDTAPSFDVDGLAWCPSAAAIDFLRQLLRKNFKKRPTASQALEHPWLSDAQCDADTCIEAPHSIPQSVRRGARLASVSVVSKDPRADSPVQKEIEEHLEKIREEPPSAQMSSLDFVKQPTKMLRVGATGGGRVGKSAPPLEVKLSTEVVPPPTPTKGVKSAVQRRETRRYEEDETDPKTNQKTISNRARC